MSAKITVEVPITTAMDASVKSLVYSTEIALNAAQVAVAALDKESGGDVNKEQAAFICQPPESIYIRIQYEDNDFKICYFVHPDMPLMPVLEHFMAEAKWMPGPLCFYNNSEILSGFETAHSINLKDSVVLYATTTLRE